MCPSDRHPVLIEPGGQPVEPIRAVHVVLNVFLASPDDLHRPVHMPCDLHGPGNAIGFQPSAEPTPDEVVVDHDLFGR